MMNYIKIMGYMLSGLLFVACGSESEVNEDSKEAPVKKSANDFSDDGSEKEKELEKTYPYSDSFKGVLVSINAVKYYDLYFDKYRLVLSVDGKKEYLEYDANQGGENPELEMLEGAEVEVKYTVNKSYITLDVKPYVEKDSFQLKEGEKQFVGVYFSGLTLEEAEGGTTDMPNTYSYTGENGIEVSGEDYATVEDARDNGKKYWVLYKEGESIWVDTIVSLQGKDEIIDVQLKKIKNNYADIQGKLTAGKLRCDTVKIDAEYGFSQAVKGYDGEQLVYVKLVDASDHGSTVRHFYISGDDIVFQFIEESYWVGNSDKVKEERVYYVNNYAVKCVYKETSGTQGYDAAKKALKSVKAQQKDKVQNMSNDLFYSLRSVNSENFSHVIQYFDAI